MVTFRQAATDYLRKITSTHSPATMRTYQRNFDAVLTPYFGPDTPLAAITGARVQEFLTSDALLRKPNGAPRAEPTKDQITGLLRNFLTSVGITDLPSMPRARRSLRLCARCRGALDTPAEPGPTAPSVAAPAANPGTTPTPAARQLRKVKKGKRAKK